MGATSPPSISAGSHPGAIEGPPNRLISTVIDVTATPDLRTWSARSLIRAASRYQVSVPAGAALTIGSPPPTSVTSPRCPAVSATTEVVSLASRSRVSSAAAAVNTLLVEAGTIGTVEPCCHNSRPVSASVTRPVNMPSAGSDNALSSA
ncbi:Uncharacterised protein [Mycobacteroides abscessus subsp. abscessus]|nr:Uncharacterised protein [Mycobacteroides abscessus subsp. abscessus]